MTDHIAVAETEIEAPPDQVWTALTEPDEIEKYMFGAQVVTDWKPDSPIVWKGEYEGKPYEDKGKILEVEPEKRLRLTHFSPLSGNEDVPANYHTLTYELHPTDTGTRVALRQDNNRTAEAAEHSRDTWAKMLSGLKAVVEERVRAGDRRS
jgi:uncharacterized protein YndB with AHSA1/START domain